jgi:hypothetical protein
MTGQMAGTRPRTQRVPFLVDNGRLRGFWFATFCTVFSLAACFTYGRVYDRQLNAISGLFVLLGLLVLATGATWYIKTGTLESNYQRLQELTGFMQVMGVTVGVTVIALLMVRLYHSRSDWTISANEVLLIMSALSFAATCIQAFRRR